MGSLRAAARGLIFATAILAAAPPPVLRFEGEARLGQRFRHDLGRGLQFILEPSRGEATLGWEITVAPPHTSHAECAEFVWPATPPFRGDNQRYLDTSYGKTAADSVRPGSVRDVAFLLDCSSVRRERKLIDMVLWPYQHKPAAVDAAMVQLGREPRAQARLRIVDSRVDAAANRIEWIRFAVEITWPR